MSNGNVAAHLLLLATFVSLSFLFLYKSPVRIISNISAKRILAVLLLIFVSVMCLDYLLGNLISEKIWETSNFLVQYPPFWVGLIGFFVGLVELVARYKDNPQTALATSAAMLYILLNVLACETVMVILQILQPDWLYRAISTEQRPLYLILSAGFGAVALFRSSLFKIKTNDGELAVGPAIILDTLLAASDRAVDRVIAPPRGTIVADIMKDVSFDRAKVALPAYCFALMQNVSHQEQKDVGDQVNYLATAIMEDKTRALNLGLVLLNVVGDKVLRCAVGNLGQLIRGEVPIEQRDIARVSDIMIGLDFGKAAGALPTYCFSLLQTVPLDAQNAFAATLQALAQSQISSKVKSLVLGLALANIVSFPVLKLAVEQLDDEIR